jgi:hypothetical protein
VSQTCHRHPGQLDVDEALDLVDVIDRIQSRSRSAASAAGPSAGRPWQR